MKNHLVAPMVFGVSFGSHAKCTQISVPPHSELSASIADARAPKETIEDNLHDLSFAILRIREPRRARR